MSDEALVVVARVVGLLALLGLAIFAIGRWYRATAKREQQAAQEHQERVQEAITRGVLNADGSPRCVVCSGLATEPSVRIGHSWLDGIPLFNRLWALAPRYIVEAADELGPRVCRSCKRMLKEYAEHALQKLRVTRSEFNSKEQDVIAALDMGGLENVARKRMAQIRIEVELMPVLAPPRETDTHQLPLITSGTQSTEGVG